MSPKTKAKLKSGAARFVDPAVALREAGAFAGDTAHFTPPELRGPAHKARGPPSEAPLAQWLTKNHTAAHLGVSTMSVDRYANDPAYAHLNFPKPSVVVDRSIGRETISMPGCARARRSVVPEDRRRTRHENREP